MQRTRRTLSAAAAILLVLAGGNCTSSTDNGNGGDADDFELQLSEAFTNNLAGFANGIQRLVAAASGSPQTGVTITPITNGVQGSVSVDVNGDGSLETSVSGSLVYINPAQGLAGGANFTLTGISGGAPQSATGSALITLIGPSTLTITNGTFSTHTDTRDNDLTLEDVNLTTNVGGSSYIVTGTAQFDFNDLEGTLTFQQDGNWFKIVVSGSGFNTFTIP